MEANDDLRYVVGDLHTVMRGVFAGADTDEVLQRIADGVRDVVGFEITAISRLGDDDVFTMLALSGSETARRQLLGRRTPMENIEREFDLADRWGLLRFIPEGRNEEAGDTGWVPDLVPVDGPDAWQPEDTLFAPLFSATNELLGLMSVDLPSNGRRPDRRTRELLEIYAVQAGIALDSARQRERLQDELRAAQATRSVAALAGRSLPVEELIRQAAEPVATGLRADTVWIVVPHGGHDEDATSDVTVWPSGEQEAGCWSGVLRGIGRQLWADGRVATLDVDETSPDEVFATGEDKLDRDELRDQGYARMVVAPMGTPDRYLGVVAALRATGHAEWTDSELEGAEDLGRELAMAVRQSRVIQRDRDLVHKLSELDLYKRQMIATLTHELKNPLTSIIGHTEMLEDLGVEEAPTAAIRRNTERLLELAKNLLVLARLDDPDAPRERTELDFRALAEEACDLLQVQAQRSGVVLQLVVPSEVVPFVGEADELGRLALNLVSNAVKFSHSGQTVCVAVVAVDDGVRLTVQDHGIGISEDDLETLFQEFRRAGDPRARAVPGSGLGLAIVRRIVDRHGGSVTVRSQPGVGSTFVVDLPRQATTAQGRTSRS